MRISHNPYEVMHDIKLIRRILDYGYERALDYAANDEICFVKERKNRSRTELLQEIQMLKGYLL
jgi:hypothetical protein